MSATSAINGLYIGQSDYGSLTERVLINSSAIPDNYKKNGKLTNPFGGELTVASAGNDPAYGYRIELTKLPKSACVSLATLNLGTSAAGYGINHTANGNVTLSSTMNNNVKGGAITPSEGVDKCNQDGAANKVTYFMK